MANETTTSTPATQAAQAAQKFVCPRCKKEFASAPGLGRHMQAMHTRKGGNGAATAAKGKPGPKAAVATQAVAPQAVATKAVPTAEVLKANLVKLESTMDIQGLPAAAVLDMLIRMR